MDGGPASPGGRAVAKPRLGIRASLIAFVLCAAGPLAIERGGELAGEQARQVAAAQQRVAAVARRAAERQEQVVADARASLRTISHLPELNPGRLNQRQPGEAAQPCAEALQTLG